MQTIDKNRYGPWAVVTGASSGIGMEFARQIAASGVNVVLVARRGEVLEALGGELARTYGIAYRAVAVDLSDKTFMGKVIAATDGLDIGLVISNAGAIVYGKFLDKSRGDLYESLHLNVTSHLNLVHHFGKHLAERGRGGVLLVSSTAGMQGTPYMIDYAAGKAYVLSLGEALHVELAPRGIEVTVLVPGPTDTPMLANSGTEPGDLPMKPMSPAECAAEGLAALTAKKSHHISGAMMRLMMAAMPRSIRPKMLGDMVGKGFNRMTAQTSQSGS